MNVPHLIFLFPLLTRNPFINKSRHLAQKYARIFVLGHYLVRVAHSFPRASLSENCSLLGTDNVRGQMEAIVYVFTSTSVNNC